MFGLLILLVVGAVAWKFAASGERFLPALAGLLTDVRIDRTPFSFFSGRSEARGRFQGRQVALLMELKRGEDAQGQLTLAIELALSERLSSSEVDTRARDEAGKRALFELAKHDLLLSAENGWLKALWRPQGFVIFPGRFSEEKWRRVLEAMQTLALSLEAPAFPASRR